MFVIRFEYSGQRLGAAFEHDSTATFFAHTTHFTLLALSFNEVSIILFEINKDIRFDTITAKLVHTFKDMGVRRFALVT
jgi:hypothetical protein